jgi:uncharacterized membrane protein YgcG
VKSTRQKILLATFLLLLAIASYRWPVLGTVFLCASLTVIGLLNQLLSIQSKELGVVTGAFSSVLALATCTGAQLSIVQLVVLTFFAALAGYGLAAARMGTQQESDQGNKDSPSKAKTGGGGDFGGGGASGSY